MQVKLNKKEFNAFLNNIDYYAKTLIDELNNKNIPGVEIVDFEKKIDRVQMFFEIEYQEFDEEKKNKLRFSFWAFFLKLLMIKLGGVIRLAPKNDYCDGTPQLIDFGNKFNTKGKKIWIGIGVDSWFNGIIEKKLLGSLQDTIDHIIDYYG
jgi:hypothetical protein